MQKAFLLLMLAANIACNNSIAQVPDGQVAQPNATDANGYYLVKTRTNATSNTWTSYTAKTIDRLPGFNFTNDPATNAYGSWMVNKSAGTGFFSVVKKADRWWIIDPDGYPFIHKGVAVFRPGTSDGQKAALNSKYGSRESWASRESQFLKQNGFNGTGAWSEVDLMHQMTTPPVYTIIVNPMGANKSVHNKKYGGKNEMAG